MLPIPFLLFFSRININSTLEAFQQYKEDVEKRVNFTEQGKRRQALKNNLSELVCSMFNP
jgi:hypothetical protein